MAKKEVCDKFSIKLKSLDFMKHKKQKCDRDGVVAERCIRSFVNMGNDVINAKDVKLALDHSLGSFVIVSHLL